MRLGEILVSVGLVSPEQLARGLEAQAQYGGRLGTNLVELGYITERQLAGTLSEQLGLPYVAAEMVGNIAPSLIAMVPLDVASEYRVFPIMVKGHVLHLCMCDPTNLEKLDALAFRLSCPVQPCVVTELTLNYALERYYGLRREPRFLPVKPEHVPTAAIVQIDEGPDEHPQGKRMSRSDFLTVESGEFRRHGIDNLPDIAPALAEARTHADILETIKSYFGAAFDKTVILSLQGTSLVPVAETGLGLDPRALPAMSLPLREDSVLQIAIRDMNLNYHKTAEDPILRAICQKTGLDIHRFTVVPVAHQRQVRYLVCGVGLDMAALKKLLPPLKAVLQKLSYTFQMLWLRQQILTNVATGPEPKPGA